MATDLSETIYWRCLEHFFEVEDLDFVVPDSMPIPYFGDVEAYLGSPRRILTAALNPSDREFPNSSLNRFNIQTGVSGPVGLEQELSNYFHSAPYSKWFSSFEHVLNGLDASYGGRMSKHAFRSTALHLDMCSPIATIPTWSKLPLEKRALLTPRGKDIFESLVDVLKPDLVIASVGWDHIKGWNPVFADGRTWPSCTTYTKKRDGNLFKAPLKVQWKRISSASKHSFLFVNGSAADTPFGRFTNDRKHQVGETLAAKLGDVG